MKVLRKVTGFLSRIEDAAAFVVFLLVFLIGLYAMYDSVLVYLHASDTSMLKYKPDYTGEAPEKPITGNMVAWLTLDGTTIDYPVMQGENNSEYLNKDPFGEYSLSGSIFLDFRNSGDFTDEYSLLYGHHMEGGVMFGGLDEFLDEDYFDSHRTGKLTVGPYQAEKTDDYEIRIFAVLETQATEEKVFAPTAVEVSETEAYLRENALYADWTVYDSRKENARLLGLSTCKYPDTADRTVVFGLLTPEENKENTEN